MIKYSEKVIFIIAQLLFLIFFVRAFVIDMGRVNGHSMEPTFNDSQIFGINRLAYSIVPPKRYDIIQHMHPDRPDTLLIKRVIGLPGEILTMKNGEVLITDVSGNTRVLDEPYIKEDAITAVSFGMQDKIHIPEDMYFVMGDNRRNSGDSRQYGPVPRSYLIGEVIH